MSTYHKCEWELGGFCTICNAHPLPEVEPLEPPVGDDPDDIVDALMQRNQAGAVKRKLAKPPVGDETVVRNEDGSELVTFNNLYQATDVVGVKGKVQALIPKEAVEPPVGEAWVLQGKAILDCVAYDNANHPENIYESLRVITDALQAAHAAGVKEGRGSWIKVQALATDQLRMHEGNGDGLDLTGRIESILDVCQSEERRSR